jgi:hypothetical protein
MASKAEITSFISDIAPLIQKEGKSRGYKIVSTAIAQACIESRWGLSGLAKYHNYFGMKCGSSWKGAFISMNTKEEYTQGQLTTIRDSFRVYNNMSDGVKGYYDFISSSRYANLKTATTPRQYAEYLKSDGYATSSSYVTTLINVVGSYELEKYDIPSEIVDTAPKTGNPYREPIINVKFNSRGNNVRWLQYELNRFGYRLVVDGIAGEKTITALKDFQSSHGLVADGICGIRTRAALMT